MIGFTFLSETTVIEVALVSNTFGNTLVGNNLIGVALIYNNMIDVTLLGNNMIYVAPVSNMFGLHLLATN